jgi:prolyl-tRNA synthetase
MPLAVRVLGRIESIVREEMQSLGAAELLVSGLQPREIWDATGRWDSVDVLYRVTSRHGAEYCLTATAEEGIVAAVGPSIRSYRDLPSAVFQISAKYRDEHRARSGLLRGRDFRMKDLYSFHLTQEQLDEYYEQVCAAYTRVFERCGIGDRTLRTFASGGVFSRFSDEFQLLHESGEDTVFVTEDRKVAINKEIAEDTQALDLVFGGKTPKLTEHRAIEVGNTFKLGSRFTDAVGLRVQDRSGESRSVLMCSYGIGTTRLLGAIAEVYGDDNGLAWSAELAPYDIHLVQLGDREASSSLLEQIKEACRAERLSMLVDDREGMRAGEKFADADLIGIPLRVVIGGKRCGDRAVEVRQQRNGETLTVDVGQLAQMARSAASTQGCSFRSPRF